ncbi:nicotinamide riboside transporter PnuC [Shewanella sp. AS1]|uniref:nicotinamide riboside transporter PnuC n=1 Tax=Shewanella sp. AS1 TaxID=2907626 RepID=UPI001F1CA73D|nr:nicotinamide riboside transporter PnuC [Shewanella sp. AS1]MCE9678927.1 nicotinamide riboside transporter PnuC [Shewanella sp. AS1]
MTEFFNVILSTFSDALVDMGHMTAWEAIAVVLALAYLWLAMRGNIWCWPAAFLSTIIYTVLFWEVALLMESMLNVYYMAMAVYGFWLWRHGRRDKKRQGDDNLAIVSWSPSRHIWIICVTTLVSLGLGYVMDNYTQASFAYLDAATTCFAVMTTYLVAQKVVENWLYWVVIDLVSIYLYFSKGLMLTSLLFVLYVGMAVAGYLMWRQEMLGQEEASRQLSYQ